MELAAFVEHMAEAFRRADALGLSAVSQRGTRTYQAGIGPHSENAAIKLALVQLLRMPGYEGLTAGQFLPYPDTPRQKCDLWVGEPLEWAIEVKMARFFGDNGRPDDTAIKDVLSPYPSDRSAVTDCLKLAEADFPSRKAMLIYGFETATRPLEPAITAFETLAGGSVRLGERCERAFGPLIHPIHESGHLFGWEIKGVSMR